ncbi:hypothetical protein ACSW29_13775 [Rhodococcus sp. GB-02]
MCSHTEEFDQLGAPGRVADRYIELQNAMGDCLQKSIGSHSELFGELHQLDADLGLWTDLVADGHTDQLSIARRELALAAHCAASGLYRQAFAGLRLFLELSFAAVYFSVNELERRRWVADKIDYSWSKGLDQDSGVLSRQFVEAFCPGLAGEAPPFAQEAATTYRHCSQFIHGKAAQSQMLPEGVFYVEKVLVDWTDNARGAGEAVIFLLLVRYADRALGSQSLIDALGSRFGHLNGVRAMIGLADA